MSREACYEARYFTCGVSTVRHGVFFLKLAKTAQNLADHFKVTLKLLVSKKGQLLCLSPVTCIPPTAHCLPPSPHQPQPHSSGTPCAGPDPASPPSPRQLIRYMGWGFLLIQHTKSCSNVAGAQTQKVLNRCLNLLQTPCMGLGRTVESCVSQLAWLWCWHHSLSSHQKGMGQGQTPLCLVHQLLRTEDFYVPPAPVHPTTSHLTIWNSIQSLKNKGGLHICACIHFLRPRRYSRVWVQWGQVGGEQGGCWDSALCWQIELLAVEEVGTRQLAARNYPSWEHLSEGRCVWARAFLKEGATPGTMALENCEGKADRITGQNPGEESRAM